MFDASAYAATAGGAAGPGFLIQILPFVAIFVLFYFLLIRPQQRRLKEHQNLIANLRRGDVVVTAGGLIGKVTRIADDEASVEVAEGVRVRVVKSTITTVRAKTEPAPANDRDVDSDSDDE